MRTIETTLYQYDELPTEEAKEKAREWFAEGLFNEDWYTFTYEDAEYIGLEISAFDLDHGTIDGTLRMNVNDTCKRIRAEHGKTCGTYRLAKTVDLRKLNCNDADVIEFTHALLEEYLSMLRQEADYIQSRESIEENIRANEYEFTADGKRA